MQQRTDSTDAVPGCDAEANPSLENSEEDWLDKMVDVPVVQVHRSTTEKAAETPQLQIEQQDVDFPEIKTPPCLGRGITRVGPGHYPQYTRALQRRGCE